MSHHALDWSKAYRTRLLALFWETVTHTYTCRRLIIYFDVSRFSLDGPSRLWVASGCQSPGRVLWWQACVFHLVSACACFMPYTIDRERVQQSCYVRGMYVWICGRTCRGAHNGWIVKWNSYVWKSDKSKNKPKTKKYITTEAAS